MNETIILEKEKIVQKWNEYIEEFFQDERGQPAVYRNIDGSDINITSI